MEILILTLKLPYSTINLKQGLCCTDGVNNTNEADKRDPQMKLKNSVCHIKDTRPSKHR